MRPVRLWIKYLHVVVTHKLRSKTRIIHETYYYYCTPRGRITGQFWEKKKLSCAKNSNILYELKQVENLKSRKMKEVGWNMKDESWKLKVEGWEVLTENFKEEVLQNWRLKDWLLKDIWNNLRLLHNWKLQKKCWCQMKFVTNSHVPLLPTLLSSLYSCCSCAAHNLKCQNIIQQLNCPQVHHLGN